MKPFINEKFNFDQKPIESIYIPFKHEKMAKTQYRTTNVIIQTILEGILRMYKRKPNQRKGIIKSHLVDYCNLKTATADKYLEKMKNAGYIKSYEEPWGDRKRIIYNITSKGRERYQWFVKINAELE